MNQNICSQTTYLFHDFSDVTAPSNPSFFITKDSISYFVADDGIHGKELWRTNGTSNGTYLLKDIRPGLEHGLADRHPYDPMFTIVEENIYFITYTWQYDSQLWLTDGTTSGTKYVHYIDHLNSENTVAFNGKLAFVTDGRLYTTNGSSSGTTMIKRITTAGVKPNIYLAVMQHDLYFVGGDNDYGYELWKTDGTTENTVLVKDIYEGPEDAFDYYGQFPNFIVADSVLYFICRHPEFGYELWRSNGTEEGTFMIKDIYPGPGDSYFGTNDIHYSPFVRTNGFVFFAADDGEHGIELWASDGTEEGTYMVKDIEFGSENSKPKNFIVFNHELYFQVRMDNSLWKTDGTEENTESFIEAISYQDFELIKASDNLMYFVKDYDYSDLWKMNTDYELTELGEYEEIETLEINDNGVYFTCNDEIYGYELWQFDNDNFTSYIVKDINKDGNSGLEQLTVANNLLFMVASDGLYSQAVWKTNGTIGNVSKLPYFSENIEGYVNHMLEYNDWLYLNAPTDSYDDVLLKTDGSVEGTEILMETNMLSVNSQFDDKFCFCDDGIWIVQGNFPGISMVQGTDNWFLYDMYKYKNGILTRDHESSLTYVNFTNNAITELVSSDFFINQCIEYKNKVYIYGDHIDFYNDEEPLHGLWESDGTAEGTNLNIPFADVECMIIFNDSIFFAGSVENTYGIYRTDGTSSGTMQIETFSYNDILPDEFILFKDDLYFSAELQSYGAELYKTDGSVNGSLLVKDINPGSSDAGISNFFATDSILFFVADDGQHGFELWQTLGSDSTTKMVNDINEQGSSFPNELVLFKGNLFFLATDQEHGEELWVHIIDSVFKILDDTISITGEVHTGQYICFLDYSNSSTENDLEFEIISGNTVNSFTVNNLGEIYIDNPMFINNNITTEFNLLIAFTNGLDADTANIIINTCLYPLTMPVTPMGERYLNYNPSNTSYYTVYMDHADTLIWKLEPDSAGVVMPAGHMAIINWNDTFHGYCWLSVQFSNACSTSDWSEPLDIFIAEDHSLEIQDADVGIYPNPSDNQVFLSNIDHIKKIEIYSLNADLIYAKTLKNCSKTAIDLGENKGVFFIKLIANNTILTRKLIMY